jgi:hypothetical protein
MGQAFASAGSPDPPLTVTGGTEFCGYSRTDPPPDREKPVPNSGLFYLLLPLASGEYTAPTADNSAFRHQDFAIHVGYRRALVPVATEADLDAPLL